MIQRLPVKWQVRASGGQPTHMRRQSTSRSYRATVPSVPATVTGADSCGTGPASHTVGNGRLGESQPLPFRKTVPGHVWLRPLPICTGTTAHPGTRSSATINHKNHRHRSCLRFQRRQPVQSGIQSPVWCDTLPVPERGPLIKEPVNRQQRFGITCQR